MTTFTILAVLRVGLGLLAAFIGRVKHVLRSDRLLPSKGLRDVFAIFGPAAVCASILLMEPPASAQQVRLDPTNDLITSFYKDPRPERLEGFLQKLETLPEGQNWEAYPPLVGFLAVVFRANPNWIERLAPARLDAKTAQTLAAAALWALISNGNQHAFVEQVVSKYVADNSGTLAAKVLSVLRSRKKE